MSITHIGDAILSQKATNVSDVTAVEVQTLIDKMFDAMSKEKGVGLAAPQVNVSQQIAIIDADGEQFVLINPEITQHSDDLVLFTEGCLSVPDKELPIIRHKKITVQYTDRVGKSCTLKAHDFLAIVCQHEIDHLNGILMTDRFEQQQLLRQTLNIEEKV
ncbi:MAG: peptide deformylase [Patescibacteria group bacterium]|nr:peptide deformylase [Patescibacteria group bacterium]